MGLQQTDGAFKKFDLAGKTALVTGGATGIGYHMTRALAQSGAKVLICARREDVLRKAAEELNADPLVSAPVVFHTVDLNSRESIDELAAHALRTLGGVDILIGNAAQSMLEPTDQIRNESIDQVLQVNLSANVELVRAFLPGMRKKKWGRILFSSTAVSVLASAGDGSAIYAASKGALNAFTRTAAVDCGYDGITVNSIILGYFLTDMALDYLNAVERAQGSEAKKKLLQNYTSVTALGRAAQCKEVEGVIQLLASDAGSYITGSCFALDGGMTITLKPNVPKD